MKRAEKQSDFFLSVFRHPLCTSHPRYAQLHVPSSHMLRSAALADRYDRG